MGEVIPLGTRLRERRAELGLSQAQAAVQLDVARTAYRLWEMDAARPAPDRWRAIAGWLGISISVLLLAEQLIDDHEAENADLLASRSGMTSTQWDQESDRPTGDYFSQERSMITDQLRVGNLSAGEAEGLQQIVTRLQNATAGAISPWHAGEFRKRFPTDERAPALARAALTATAVGIPAEALEAAALLTSEVVTNSVRHSGSDWIDVAVALRADALRVEVGDQSTQSIRPRTPDLEGGWGMTILSELATRWGVERTQLGKVIWFECELDPTP